MQDLPEIPEMPEFLDNDASSQDYDDNRVIEQLFANLENVKFSRRYWNKRIDGAERAAKRYARISEKRIETFLAASHFQALLDTLDPEFQEYETLTCNKTGQPIGQQSPESISHTIQVHEKNRKRAHEILQLHALQQCAPSWIHTDPDALKTLICDDPIGFFVHFSSQIISSDALAKSNDLAQERRWRLHVQKREAFAWIQARVYKDEKTDTNLLRELHATNQLLSKVLAIRTFNLTNRRPALMRCFTPVLTNNHENLALYLGAWIVSLRDALRYLVAERAASNAKKAAEAYRMRAPTVADIANIRLDFGGNKALQLMGHATQRHADEHIASMLSAALDLKQREGGKQPDSELTRELRAKRNKTAAKRINLIPRGAFQQADGEPGFLSQPTQPTQPTESLENTFAKAFNRDKPAPNGAAGKFSFSLKR